jgi:hypothetical protein
VIFFVVLFRSSYRRKTLDARYTGEKKVESMRNEEEMNLTRRR